ncbi:MULTISPECIES: S24 family peptidase [unclassified Brucella]|uniref:LexA family transcriptional regulator n=1 Tax=unclassified Brucella TaxID=2632610 RepID=UPI0012AD3985|nr:MULTISPECIES: S24 family peptidase [unclassified Brucella]MRN41967.1 helix-turn-helix domain-containing protein [Brucella sp. 09RB8913]MRN58964.1 helix-turn-helix domain-containing protein [Brucella sp. 09RB8918]CAB4326200.1 putative HTH-type transcriptional regulator [Brucella sp. 191011898]
MPNWEFHGVVVEEIDAHELAFRERIRDAIQMGGKSGVMSEKTGIPTSTLNKYVALRSSPNGINAWKIAQAIGSTVEELVSGEVPKKRKNSQLGESASMQSTNLVAIPRYDVQAAAGDGIIPTNEKAEEAISIARSFLRDVGANPNACIVLESRGDSMLPTIPGGSLLVVDRSKIEIEDEMVFVFRAGPGIKVKRAMWRVDGNLDLVSDNEVAGYPPETFGPDRADELAPIGQVMLVLRQP